MTTKPGGRVLTCVMYRSLMRRPPGAGGGCASIMPVSQRLSFAVATRRFQTVGLFTASRNRSMPRPVLAETVTKGAPRNWGNNRSNSLSARAAFPSCPLRRPTC